MTATSTPTLDMLPNMREVAAVIAEDTREEGGVVVISIGPLWVDLAVGGRQYSVWVIVPKRDGKDYASSQIILDIAQRTRTSTVNADDLYSMAALRGFTG